MFKFTYCVSYSVAIVVLVMALRYGGVILTVSIDVGLTERNTALWRVVHVSKPSCQLHPPMCGGQRDIVKQLHLLELRDS